MTVIKHGHQERIDSLMFANQVADALGGRGIGASEFDPENFYHVTVTNRVAGTATLHFAFESYDQAGAFAGFVNTTKDGLFSCAMNPPILEHAGEVHALKTDPIPFRAILAGHKGFDVRVNDRGYKAGDRLDLREWDDAMFVESDPESGYTGTRLLRVISYVLQGEYGLPDDVAVLGLYPGGSMGLKHACGHIEYYNPKHSPEITCGSPCPSCHATSVVGDAMTDRMNSMRWDSLMKGHPG